MMVYDLVVVGAGPAGIFSAIYAAKKGLKVALVEKMKRLGNKILVAGAGKCNLTHEGDYKDFLNRYGTHGKFLKPSLYNYQPQELINFFKENGLPLVKIEESGKYFPETFKSIDVVNLLTAICKNLKIDLYLNSPVDCITKETIFSIKSNDLIISGKNVLISTGGKSYPSVGTTGDGYNLAKKFGHSIIEPKPALTPVYVKDYIFSDLSGISFPKAKITILRDNKKIAENIGPLLITHDNFSGPGILDCSRYMEKNDILEINFENLDEKKLESSIIETAEEKGKRTIKKLLSELNYPDRFIKKILKINEIPEDTKLAELTKIQRNKIVSSLCKNKFSISRMGDYNIAMVTTGGVSIDSINPKTLESKLVKGLYFAGEVLDIDGDTGGFNIQAAISMGVLVSKNII